MNKTGSREFGEGKVQRELRGAGNNELGRLIQFFQRYFVAKPDVVRRQFYSEFKLKAFQLSF